MENIINLCMDSYNMEKQSGRLYHRYTSGPVLFSSLFEAMSHMDRLYDRIGFPQSSTRIRSFQDDCQKEADAVDINSKMPGSSGNKGEEVKEMEALSSVIGQRGKCATFLIAVRYRQHSSWQGEVTWVDEQKKEYFRSALELIRLLDSALSSEKRRK